MQKACRRGGMAVWRQAGAARWRYAGTELLSSRGHYRRSDVEIEKTSNSAARGGRTEVVGVES